MNGFINLLKPPGMTSSDAVLAVRKKLPRGVKVGHGGTLDPDAAGVLPICLGRATRLFDYMIDKSKTYTAELTLGVETDTQDASGKVVRVSVEIPGEADVRGALPALTGQIMQTPPLYSAIKRDGQRMYDLARGGGQAELEPREARVESIEYIEDLGRGRHMLRIVCGKGVYIRTICSDIGRALGCGGHMSMLIRERAGGFSIEDAATLERLEELAAAGRLHECVLPMDAPLSHLPRVRLDAELRAKVLNGAKISCADAPDPGPFRLYVGEEFAGIGQAGSGGEIIYRAVLMERDAC